MPRKKSPTSEMKPSKQAKTPLAQRINSLITDANELKDYLDCTIQAVNQFRYGESRPSLENLCKIADFYNVSTDYLLGRTDEPSATPDVQATCLTTGLSGEAVSALNLYSNRESITVTAKGCTRQSIDTVDKLISSKSFLRFINQLTFYLIYGAYLSEDISIQTEKRLTPEEYEEHQRFYKWANDRGLEIMLRDDVAEMHLQTACDELKAIFREILENEKAEMRSNHAINQETGN